MRLILAQKFFSEHPNKYDTKEVFNVDSKAEWMSDQLNLAHVATSKKKYEKEKTKTNKRQCTLNSVHVEDP